MEKKIIACDKTNDKYTHIKHSSGLNILVWEMDGFSTTEALFGTKYGSINTRFKTNKDKDYTVVPEGIAHFLEHKLFENEDTDVFELFAKTGASANAYTSFDKTCYLFSCSDNYKESLEILLNFVQSPYFTKESVDKEQGIIGQEIRMCDDNPSWRVFFNMLNGLYKSHPVKIDIAGTIESIAKIDADLLYKCYNTFYNLNNMVLVVAGNVKADEVIDIADKCLKPSEDIELETVFLDEPDEVVKSEIVDNLPVGTPMFNIGFKVKPRSAYENLKLEMELHVAMNVLSDAASPLYKRLTDEGLINSTFSTEIFNGDGFFTVIFAGESNQPRKVLTEIIREIENVKVNGLDREHYESIKKSTYGQVIREFNNVEAVASTLINSYFAGVNPFDTVKVLSEMTYEDVQKSFCENIDTEKVTLSIVES
ncbi:MAG: insulinase family protein [Clostridiales bacterium]|jgi:predicted Zn-dependent peptidase|nr:insulinase family protein [Clostridiales bacterium]